MDDNLSPEERKAIEKYNIGNPNDVFGEPIITIIGSVRSIHPGSDYPKTKKKDPPSNPPGED